MLTRLCVSDSYKKTFCTSLWVVVSFCIYPSNPLLSFPLSLFTFSLFSDAAKRIAQVKVDAKLPCDVEEYVGQFKPHMMEVVYKWCQGAKFSDICSMTQVFEGSIIRGMRRLEELLRQFGSAAKSIGNAELEKKFHDGIDKIKRDIVFAASLYL